MIRNLGFGLSLKSFCYLNLVIIGSEKAIVLPDPVLSLAIRSSPR